MGQIRKVGDTYYIEFFARGLMYSQIAGPDLAAAQKLLDETEKKIAGGEALTVVRHIDLAVFFQDFIGFATKEFGTSSTERFDRMLEHFSGFLKRSYPGISTLSQITPSVLESYKASRSPSTKPHLVNFTLLLLREVLEYGIKLGFINDNPSLHVSLIQISNRNFKATKRYQMAEGLLNKNVGLGRACQLMQLTDIARMMYYANLISLIREDAYNKNFYGIN